MFSVYIFLKKLNSLLDRLGNRCTMHGYQSNTLKWVRGSQKYVHYYSVQRFTGYKYPICIALIVISYLIFLVFLGFFSLALC
jgi:hypothetical protein